MSAAHTPAATAAPKRSPKSVQAPAGDTRLSINIRNDVHRALKLRAIQEDTTVGELVEGWVHSWSVINSLAEQLNALNVQVAALAPLSSGSKS